MNRKTNVLVILFLILLFFSPGSESQDDYYTVVDNKEGEVIFETAMQVTVGDYYINEENKKYKVVAINGKQAKAEFEKKVELIASKEDQVALTQGLVAQQDKKVIALYHTHSDESYTPTSGTHSKPGNGDIQEVTASLAQALEQKGIQVRYSDAKHDPHDGGSYERSRRTAAQLSRQRPDALLDIHRDGVPNSEEYTASISGREVAKIRLVVGRQNPQVKVIDQFAKQFKAVTDQHYPGLVKGIYYAKGKYNQDLSPRSLLLEMGTHVIPAKLAVNSVDLVADSINELLYGSAQGSLPETSRQEQNSSSINSILVILVITFLGVGLFLVANEGSLAGVVSRLKNWTDSDPEG
ncbi:stage II sporulation protein P [Halanaerobaculum tunisiense]